MIILDTNLVSELIASRPAPAVAAWAAEQALEGLSITALQVFEIERGVATLPNADKALGIRQRFERFLSEGFAGRIFAFDDRAASILGRLMVDRQKAGRRMDDRFVDAQIAAIALAQGSTIATRDVADFMGLGVNLINPWTGETYGAGSGER